MLVFVLTLLEERLDGYVRKEQSREESARKAGPFVYASSINWRIHPFALIPTYVYLPQSGILLKRIVVVCLIGSC